MHKLKEEMSSTIKKKRNRKHISNAFPLGSELNKVGKRNVGDTQSECTQQ
jgi:hypothetical protein